jgi:hypothetical protein
MLSEYSDRRIRPGLEGFSEYIAEMKSSITAIESHIDDIVELARLHINDMFQYHARYGYKGWAVLESECAFKDRIVCAQEGTGIIQSILLLFGEGAFDDFAGTSVGIEECRRILGLE